MSRWIREHLGGLGFGGARRPPPPEPPQPDYSAEPELPCGVVLVEPDLERVYRAQRDRDFADPYTTTDQSDGLRESGAARPGEGETKEAVRPSLPPQPPPGLTSASPKHRLIRVAGKGTGVHRWHHQRSARTLQRDRPPQLRRAPPYRATSAAGRCPSSLPPRQPPARDSRMPKDDDRPPEEYDQPWEWKRDCISQAFAADVSCTDELPWPPPVGQLDGEAGPSIMPGGPESSGDGRDSLRSSLAHGDTDAEPVGMAAEEPQGNRAGTDTADRAMGQQLWFHGDIGRVEAEQILQQHRTSSFLERRGVCAHACVVGPGRPRGARRKLSALRLGSGGRPLLPRTAPAGAGRRAALPAAPRAAALLLLCHVARPACASSPSERRRPLALLEARVAIRVCNSVPLAAESRGACHTARSASPGGRRAPRAQP
ncbi:SH2 domain-containing adapter protein D-like isoform X9 [Petromyzon marinus]|uniref:SH2 domain-containing adapter protein D-like isoform X9 n=1 Tax=Petromyzon marinus TaxID=7757 RepID=UPI003F72E61F